MVLDKLGTSLRNVLAKVAKSMFVDETVVLELTKELQKALLLADVNTRQVLEISKVIKERALKEEPPSGITKKEFLIRIVYDELVKVVGGKPLELTFEQQPTFIMMVGLFGSGKTTHCGKLAKYFAKRGKKVALVGLDTFRPAAMKQLVQVGQQAHVPVFIDEQEKDAVKLFERIKPELAKFDVVLVDTSGRDALSEDLIAEITAITAAVQPDHVWLVLSGDIGQAARTQAQGFKDACGVSGVIVTKLDGTAKGGGALTACAVTGAPIVFIGVGEKIDDLEVFNPEGFIGRLLGMGDLQGLLEKVQDAVSIEDAEHMEARLLKGEFNLLDLYQQMEAMANMGSIGKLMEMIPGMSQIKLPKEALEGQEARLKLWKHAMNSMTKGELEDPEIITPERMERIAAGSGTNTDLIRELMKQYRQAKKMVKMFKGGAPKDPKALMKKLGKKGFPMGKM